jgi:hypothetical protein
MSYEPVRTLSPDAIHLAALRHVFGPWDLVYGTWRCQVCGEVLFTERYTKIDVHCGADQIVDAPSINRLWLLPTAVGLPEGQKKLLDLPVVIAHLPQDDQWGLAQTCPHNARWELTEAYMRLGYLPPLALVKDGLGEPNAKVPSRLTLWVLAGARETTLLIGNQARETRAILEQARAELEPKHSDRKVTQRR